MLIALLPETILVATALAVLGLGVSVPKSRTLITAATLLGGFAAATAIFLLPADGNFLHGMVVLEPLARMFKLVILGLGLAAVVFASDSFPETHFAESLALILFSTVGMMLLVGTEDLLMIFIALELTSIPLYVLAAFDKQSRPSAEAGLKYFLIGSVSAAFLLYGLSLIYGVTGSTNLQAIARFSGAPDPLLIAGIALTLAGFAFKVAAVPFQLWAPDVYEGAPTAAAALIASGSKVAGIFILARILTAGLGGWAGSAGWGQFLPGWAPVLALMAAASVLLGNIAALVQSNVKRLLAYSAIAHGGYLLIGLSSGGLESSVAVLFYVVVYALTTAGAFGVVAIVEKQRGGSRLEDFDGLAKSSPVLALCLLVFFISLAGIPPLAGFFGKFFLFTAALRTPSLLWLVILAVAMNAVSLYYYLIVLKHAFVFPAPEELRPANAPASGFLVAALALSVLALGLAPDLLLTPLANTMASPVRPGATGSTGVPPNTLSIRGNDIPVVGGWRAMDRNVHAPQMLVRPRFSVNLTALDVRPENGAGHFLCGGQSLNGRPAKYSQYKGQRHSCRWRLACHGQECPCSSDARATAIFRKPDSIRRDARSRWAALRHPNDFDAFTCRKPAAEIP